MDMVPVGANLQELELIASLDPQTDVPQCLVNRRVEHRSSVFGRKHQMVKQNRDVIALVDVEAHPRDSSLGLTPQAAGDAPKGIQELCAEFSGDDWTGWTLHVVDASGQCVLDLPLESLMALT